MRDFIKEGESFESRDKSRVYTVLKTDGGGTFSLRVIDDKKRLLDFTKDGSFYDSNVTSPLDFGKKL